MADNKPVPSAPTRKLSVQPSKQAKKDTWHTGLRVANRVSPDTLVKLGSLVTR